MYKLYCEAINTAPKLDGLLVLDLDGKSATPYKHWGVENPKFTYYLRVWGEGGVVKLKKIGTPKLENRGEVCMFVGYAINHTSDCYRMYNESTDQVYLSRDIRWLNRMYFGTDGKRQEDASVFNEFDKDDVEWVHVDEETNESTPEDNAGNVPNQDNRVVIPIGSDQAGGTVTTDDDIRYSTRV